MTSVRKTIANRANAEASTGPKTARGKSRAAKNARRYGLSLSIVADPTRSPQVEKLARAFVDERATADVLAAARAVAEAQLDLLRIRAVRHDLLPRDLGGADYAAVAQQLLRIDRYERRALSRRKFAIRALDAAREQAAA